MLHLRLLGELPGAVDSKGRGLWAPLEAKARQMGTPESLAVQGRAGRALLSTDGRLGLHLITEPIAATLALGWTCGLGSAQHAMRLALAGLVAVHGGSCVV